MSHNEGTTNISWLPNASRSKMIQTDTHTDIASTRPVGFVFSFPFSTSSIIGEDASFIMGTRGEHLNCNLDGISSIVFVVHVLGLIFHPLFAIYFIDLEPTILVKSLVSLFGFLYQVEKV